MQRARLRAKLEARKAAAPAPAPPESVRPIPPPGAADILPKEWADSHRFTMVAFDRSAVLRTGASLALYAALMASTVDADGRPLAGASYALSVPMKHAKLQLAPGKPLYLSPEGVVRLAPSGVEVTRVGTEECVTRVKDATLEPLPAHRPTDAFAVSVRVYARERQPCGFKCNLGEGGRREYAIEVPNRSDRNKAERATRLRVADGEDDFRANESRPTVVPLRAALLCAQRFAPDLLAPVRAELTGSGGYAILQPGVALCRASLIYPRCVGTPFADELLVAIADAHIFAAAMLLAPNTATLLAFYSHEWGAYRVVSRADGTLAVEHYRDRVMHVITLERYNDYLAGARKTLSTECQAHVGVGDVWLCAKNAPVRATAVVTYAQLLGCRSLLTHRVPQYIAKGLQVVALRAGERELYDPAEWGAERERQLRRFQTIASSAPEKLRVKTLDDEQYIDVDAMVANESDDTLPGGCH